MKTNTPYSSTYIWNLGGEEVKFTETDSRKVTRGWNDDGGQEK